jgi:hypothetical protein
LTKAYAARKKFEINGAMAFNSAAKKYNDILINIHNNELIMESIRSNQLG